MSPKAADRAGLQEKRDKHTCMVLETSIMSVLCMLDIDEVSMPYHFLFENRSKLQTHTCTKKWINAS